MNLGKLLIIGLSIFSLVSCNEIKIEEGISEESGNKGSLTATKTNALTSEPILNLSVQNQCEEISDNLLVNGNFEDVLILKSWMILNKNDNPDLGWDVDWSNKRPCGKNIVDSRLEIQRLSGNQVLELDSDCQGNDQFSLLNPIKREKTKIKVSQEVDLVKGQYYKLSFRVKKRKDNVQEHLQLRIGKYRQLFHNDSLTTDWSNKEIIFQAKDKHLDENSKSRILFNPIKGSSDTFGLFIDDVRLSEVTYCPVVKNKCSTVNSVISYNPVGNINSDRMNLEEVLGQSDGEPYNPNDVNFVSLGYGGDIVLEFNPRVVNVHGNDLRIYEVTGGNNNFNQYPEEADVYASNNLNKWTYLGRVKNDNDAPSLGEVDLGKMKKARYIKIVDVTDESLINNGDGFDVDAVECLYQDEYVWNSKIFYFDKTHSSLYSVRNNKNKVKLKDLNKKSLYENPVHIGLSPDKKYVYSVDSTYPNSVVLWDLKKGTKDKLMDLNIGKVTMVSVSSTGKLYVGNTNHNKIYMIDLGSGIVSDLGSVYVSGSKLNLQGGDLAFTDKKMYITTQSNGGRLLEIDIVNNRLEGNILASNLGKVSGLAIIDYDHFLMSVLNNDMMLELKDNVLKEKDLHGDLMKQGSGADLASNSPELPSKF